MEAEALGGGRGKGVASSGSGAMAVPVGLNIVGAREDSFGGLFTTNSDNVGGQGQGSSLGVGGSNKVRWEAKVGINERARWALMAAGVGRGT